MIQPATANPNIGLTHGALLPQAIGEEDRAVLAAGAADGDGQVTAVGGGKAWQPTGQKTDEVGEHGRHFDLGFEKKNNLSVVASELSQLRFPIGVGQTADVKDKIGVQGNTVLEAEGCKQNGHLAVAVGNRLFFNQIPQLVEGHIAGVDLTAGDGDNGIQQLPFHGQCLG